MYMCKYTQYTYFRKHSLRCKNRVSIYAHVANWIWSIKTIFMNEYHHLRIFWALDTVFEEAFIAGPIDRLNIMLVMDSTGAKSFNLKTEKKLQWQ